MTVSIHQILPSFSYGDATSAQVIEIRNYLRGKGFRSRIFALNVGERMENEASLLEKSVPEPGSVLLYHHSIGSDILNFLEKHEGIRGIIYHNITPSHYFNKYNPVLSELTDLGRDQLSDLKNLVQLTYGDSEYNCRELKHAGFKDPGILPIIVDPKKWKVASDSYIKENYGGDERANILFVGRISPNKSQKELVQMQYYLKQLMSASRLLLVGKYEESDLYYQEVKKEISSLGLEDDVILPGKVSTEELKSYYEVSDLFLSFSEHEGFGVPLIEAMWFDLPVLAYSSSAVPETLGEAALMFNDKTNLAKAAAMVKITLRDNDLLDSLLEAQRKRRKNFVPEKISTLLENMLERIEALEEERHGLKKEPVKKPPRIAFVVQRCGKEVNGGAELHCRQVAQRMTKYWDTEVLTPCALDYLTWDNVYSPGIEYLNGVKIRRFEVDHPRNLEKFGSLSNSLITKGFENCSLQEQEEWMKVQGPYSSDLFNYIREERERYDFFVFFTYLYATAYFGLQEARGKACLVPTAHDEWPIYMQIYKKVFSLPSVFVFNTPEEKNFIQKRFPALNLPGPVSGVGIEKPENINPERFRKKFKLHEPFILYLGRIDTSKGCDLLFEYFKRFKKKHHSDLKLVLAGKSVMQIPDDPDIVHAGFVTEQTKWNALSACSVLVNPSIYESLSMVLLEAWSVGKPVLVNGKCEVLKNQTERAKGGRSFYDYETFSSTLLDLLSEGSYMKEAEEFVNNNYNWEKIEKDYLKMADKFLSRTSLKS